MQENEKLTTLLELLSMGLATIGDVLIKYVEPEDAEKLRAFFDMAATVLEVQRES